MSGSSGPSVAVVIPTYKREMKLKRAVESVYNQSYTDWKLYVINDAPTHDVSGLLPDDDRILYIQHNVNKGAPAARNTGIQTSEESYIALLDDDDVWKESKLEKQMALFENLSEEYGMVYTGEEIVENGKIINQNKAEVEGDLFQELLRQNHIPSQTPLIRREVFDTIGMFDTSLPSSQDIDLWLRIAKNYKIASVPELLTISYQGHEDRISKDPQRKYEGHKYIIKKYRTDLENDPVALGTKFKHLGVFAAYLEKYKEAHEYFKKARSYLADDSVILGYLILSALPRPLANIGFDIQYKVVDSYNKRKPIRSLESDSQSGDRK